MYTDGPIPGVPGATIWPTGLYRPAFSPNKERWAIRVNRTSGNDDEYFVSGMGTAGTAILHGRGTAAANPAGIASVFYIAERGLSVNDSGQLAFSGSTVARATTDTIWRMTPGSPIEVVARELDPLFIQPTAGQGQFRTDIGGPQIANTGEVVFPMSDTRTESTDRDAIFRWDGVPNTYVELVAEGAAFTNTGGAVLEDINTAEANAVRGSCFYFRADSGSEPVFGFFGDTNGATSEDKLVAMALPGGAGFESVYREGTTVDGVFLPSTPSVVGWIDAAGNVYGVSGGALGVPAAMFGHINGVKVVAGGEPVGGNVAGENWSTAATTLLISAVFALDRNAAGGYIVGGGTDNPDLTRNQVIIYVSPTGQRTELLRRGDTLQVDIGGNPETRTITNFSQQDAGYAVSLTDTHLYFLAETSRASSTVNGDLYARIALPGGSCTPPAVVADPQSARECHPANSTSFAVDFTGSGPVSVRFQREVEGVYVDLSDGPLPGSNAVVSGVETGTLTIVNADDAAVGNYRARVFNACGEVFSQPAAFTRCPADFDCSGFVNPDDLADYISAFFSDPPGAGADFDRSGMVNPDDLADYIAVFFGPACS
jgi:hypothetical protein